MATISSATALTLADLANRQTADGKIDSRIIEILGEQNEILQDLLWIEANDGTGHKTTIRSGLPGGTWRMLNYGVQPEKSTTVQVRDGAGMLETYSKVDKQLVDMASDKAAFRMSEDKPFIEGMNQSMADTLFYGDLNAAPEKFMGLSSRFSSTTAENGGNIIKASTTAGADNTSIWLVAHDADTFHGIYPRGSVAGLKVRDLGEDTISDGNGGEYQGFRTHYKWDCGISVRDWRYIVRIANIKPAALTKNAATGADLVDLMQQAVELIPTQGKKLAFYCNRNIRSALRRQISNKANVWLDMADVGGKRVLTFDNIPVRRVDALRNNEALVV